MPSVHLAGVSSIVLYEDTIPYTPRLDTFVDLRDTPLPRHFREWLIFKERVVRKDVKLNTLLAWFEKGIVDRNLPFYDLVELSEEAMMLGTGKHVAALEALLSEIAIDISSIAYFDQVAVLSEGIDLKGMLTASDLLELSGITFLYANANLEENVTASESFKIDSVATWAEPLLILEALTFPKKRLQQPLHLVAVATLKARLSWWDVLLFNESVGYRYPYKVTDIVNLQTSANVMGGINTSEGLTMLEQENHLITRWYWPVDDVILTDTTSLDASVALSDAFVLGIAADLGAFVARTEHITFGNELSPTATVAPTDELGIYSVLAWGKGVFERIHYLEWNRLVGNVDVADTMMFLDDLRTQHLVPLSDTVHGLESAAIHHTLLPELSMPLSEMTRVEGYTALQDTMASDEHIDWIFGLFTDVFYVEYLERKDYGVSVEAELSERVRFPQYSYFTLGAAIEDIAFTKTRFYEQQLMPNDHATIQANATLEFAVSWLDSLALNATTSVQSITVWSEQPYLNSDVVLNDVASSIEAIAVTGMLGLPEAVFAQESVAATAQVRIHEYAVLWPQVAIAADMSLNSDAEFANMIIIHATARPVDDADWLEMSFIHANLAADETAAWLEAPALVGDVPLLVGVGFTESFSAHAVVEVMTLPAFAEDLMMEALVAAHQSMAYTENIAVAALVEIAASLAPTQHISITGNADFIETLSVLEPYSISASVEGADNLVWAQSIELLGTLLHHEYITVSSIVDLLADVDPATTIELFDHLIIKADSRRTEYIPVQEDMSYVLSRAIVVSDGATLSETPLAGHLYVQQNTSTAYLTRYHTATGEQIWRITLPSSPRFTIDPRGYLFYISDSSGYVTGYRAADALTLWRGDIGYSTLWVQADRSGNVYTADWRGNVGRFREDGALAWTVTVYWLPYGHDLTPDETLFLVGDYYGYISFINKDTGVVENRVRVDTYINHIQAGSKAIFAASTSSGSLYALDYKGTVLWSVPVTVRRMQLSPDQSQLVISDGSVVLSYDATTGTRLWGAYVDAATAFTVEDMVYLTYAGFLEARDLQTGTVIWRASIGDTGVSVVAIKPAVFVSLNSARVLRIEPYSGEVVYAIGDGGYLVLWDLFDRE